MPGANSPTWVDCINLCVGILGLDGKGQQIAQTPIEAVDANGNLYIKDGVVRTTGDTTDMRPGTTVPVIWTRKNANPGHRSTGPVSAIQHHAKKPSSDSSLKRNIAGVIEVLFIGPEIGSGGPSGRYDVWYWSITEARPMHIRAALGDDPEMVQWSEEGNGFYVRTIGAVYHVFSISGSPNISSTRKGLAAKLVRTENLGASSLVVTTTTSVAVTISDIITQVYPLPYTVALARGHLMFTTTVWRIYLPPSFPDTRDVYVVDTTAGARIFSSEGALRSAGEGDGGATIYQFDGSVLRYGKTVDDMRIWLGGTAVVTYGDPVCTYAPNFTNDVPPKVEWLPLELQDNPASPNFGKCVIKGSKDTFGFFPPDYGFPASPQISKGGAWVVDGGGAIKSEICGWEASNDTDLGGFWQVPRVPYIAFGQHYAFVLRDSTPGDDPGRGLIYLVSLDTPSQRSKVESHSIYGSQRVTLLEYDVWGIPPRFAYVPLSSRQKVGQHAIPSSPDGFIERPNDPVQPVTKTPCFLRLADVSSGSPTLTLGELNASLPVETSLQQVSGLVNLPAVFSPTGRPTPSVALEQIFSGGPGGGLPYGVVEAAASYSTPLGESPIGPLASTSLPGDSSMNLRITVSEVPTASAINLYLRLVGFFDAFLLWAILPPGSGSRVYMLTSMNAGIIPSVASPRSFRVIYEQKLLGRFYRRQDVS